MVRSARYARNRSHLQKRKHKESTKRKTDIQTQQLIATRLRIHDNTRWNDALLGKRNKLADCQFHRNKVTKTL